MPNKKSLVPHRMINESIRNLVAVPRTSLTPRGVFNSMRENPKRLSLIVLILALLALFLANKGLLLAAVVNGQPIFSWELNSVMASRFGKQTLEGMISERLIADAGKKADVSVSPKEVEDKEREIVKGLGGNVSIEELLKFQGMSKSDFDSQIRLQLLVQKILGKDLVITEKDVDNYIATNRALLAATEPAALRAEARQAILDAKIGEKLQPWFLELKEKAKILRLL